LLEHSQPLTFEGDPLVELMYQELEFLKDKKGGAFDPQPVLSSRLLELGPQAKRIMNLLDTVYIGEL
jgi:hypothetical protein